MLPGRDAELPRRGEAARQSGTALAVAALLAGVALLYAPALRFEWLSYDDTSYVTQNPLVLAGSRRRVQRWALTSAHAGNWHPLTWLSHMLDVDALRRESRRASRDERRATRRELQRFSSWCSCAHRRRRGEPPGRGALRAPPAPARVRCVGSERKNLLEHPVLAAHDRCVRALCAAASLRARYAAVTALFALGLMAKPMLVTLPFVLLLLDGWPLARAGRPRGPLVARARRREAPAAGALARVVLVTMHTQRAGAMDRCRSLPLTVRLAYAAVSYLRHLAHAVALSTSPCSTRIRGPRRAPPTRGEARARCSPSPHHTASRARRAPRARAARVDGCSVLGRSCPSSVSCRSARRRWRIATPTCRASACGSQSSSAAPPRSSATFRSRSARSRASLWLVAACTFLAAASHAQLGYWQRSRTLFERAIAVTGPNPVMHNELGVVLAREGSHALALEHFEVAVSLAPGWASAQQNLGAVLATLGRPRRRPPAPRTQHRPRPERGLGLRREGVRAARPRPP